MLPDPPLTVCFVGHYERDYPRNAIVRATLAEMGHRVVECHSTRPFPWRHADLFRQFLRVRETVDVVWVAEGGHRLVPLVKAWATAVGLPVVFDPFTSRYNTRVEDRALMAPNGFGARIAAWQDWSACRAADHLVFDTHDHERYFRERYRFATPSSVVEIAVDESCFDPRVVVPHRRPDGCFDVLFYGTYIPLQGVDTIVEAAMQLRDLDDLHFTLIGGGQTRPAVAEFIAEHALSNVTSIGSVSPHELARHIAGADLCLGIFGATTKAANVVANKVVQCAAMGKAIVTRRSTAIERYFAPDVDIVMVEPADPAALATAIVGLRNDDAARQRLGVAARAVYDASFSNAALRRRLTRLLRQLVPPR